MSNEVSIYACAYARVCACDLNSSLIRVMCVCACVVCVCVCISATAGLTLEEVQLLAAEGRHSTRMQTNLTPTELQSILSTRAKQLSQRDSSQVKVADVPNVRWEDLGGLDKARDELMDAVMLPMKAPEMFGNGKLKLR